MKHTRNTNRILPVAGVYRCPAAESNTIHPNRTNDVSSANPSGTDATEKCSRRPAVLLKPTRTTKIASFNVRTIKDNSRLDELVYNANNYNIAIVGIQEHRCVHEEPVHYTERGGYHLITTSAWRNTQQAAIGGVGLLISTAAERALCNVKPISRRILLATFDGNPATSVIVAYSPTNCSDATEIDEFYRDLNIAITSVPPHNFLTIVGDMNAKISADHVQYPYHSTTNRNGQLLAELIAEKSMKITNTSFQKKMGKRWTFTDPCGRHHLLDYIIVNQKWKNSVTNAEPYSSFSSVGSDHRIVTMSVALSLRTPKTIFYVYKI